MINTVSCDTCLMQEVVIHVICMRLGYMLYKGGCDT